MKKRTKKQFKKAFAKLNQSLGTDAKGKTALGVLTMGGLAVAVARDPAVRERARSLAHVALDRAFDMLGGQASEQRATRSDEEEADISDGHESDDLNESKH
jgi:hypothetical protein